MDKRGEHDLRSYGRRRGRKPSSRQAALWSEVYPRFALPLDSPPPSPLAALFPAAVGDVWLEIGFGGGEHLAAQAAQRPDWGFLGVEPFLNGVAKAISAVEAAGLANVRLRQGDVRDLLPQLPDGALERVDMLFPDPWPKTRHWKRRLVQPALLAEIARVLRPGGAFRFATDWAHYAAWTLERLLAEPRLAWTAETARDWREPWPGHTPTRYQEKCLGDHAPIWITAIRRGEAP